MKEIGIAEVLVNKRKEKGLTQDEVANYIGVSKASVSKWETGQSYPDIILLPQLASYYNISIDELVGYKPQMTKENIHKLCRKLASEFACRPFNEVMNSCRDIIKKYFACFPLLLQIGVLILNHSTLSRNRDEALVLIEEAKALFARVKSESEDAELSKQALYMEASCFISLGDPDMALDLFEGVNVSVLPIEVLLASAYQMTGKNENAKAVLQIGIYQCVVSIFTILSSYITLCADDPQKFGETLHRAFAVAEAFNLKKLHPTILMNLYISAAQVYIGQKRTEEALDMLQSYAEIATGDIYPLHLRGDNYFDLLDNWLTEADFGTTPMRDERTVRLGMADIVTNNPVFSVLADNLRFKSITEKLSNN